MDNEFTTLNLHYLDKLHGLLTDVGKSVNRSFVALFVQSSVLLANATSIVGIGSEVELSGIKVTFSSWVIPFLIGWIGVILYIHLTGLLRHEFTLEKNIERIYRSLNYNEESISHNLTSYPNIVVLMSDSIVSMGNLNRVTKFFGILVAAIPIFLPVFVQMYAAYKYALVDGLVSWLAMSFSLSSVVMLAYISNAFLWVYRQF